MVTIIFESHSTTFDNEAHLASGHNDVTLSSLGEKQAKELGGRRGNENFDAIFCSDLQRSYRTAEIAFGEKFPVIKDKRLWECDYGDLTGNPSSEVDPLKIKHINEPFPNGASYKNCLKKNEGVLRRFKTNVLRSWYQCVSYWSQGYPLWIRSLDKGSLFRRNYFCSLELATRLDI